jgi:hypothetical protein
MTVPVGITMVDYGGVRVTSVPNAAWAQQLGPTALKTLKRMPFLTHTSDYDAPKC